MHTVFVLIPVHNRIHHSLALLRCLERQTYSSPLTIVFIDDGSTDDTYACLSAYTHLAVLRGNGTLWWAGSIDLGLQYALQKAGCDDYILLMNNDVEVDDRYVETLVNTSLHHGMVPVGSVIHDRTKIPPLLSIGPRVDVTRMAVWDLLSEQSAWQLSNPKPTYRVDALSGRGSLYPVSLFRQHGTMRPHLLPHYFADYELAMRLSRDSNKPLLVSSDAVVYSDPVFGNDLSHLSRWERLFSRRSSANVVNFLTFYMLVGSPIQRLTAPLRFLYFSFVRNLRNLRLW